MTFPLTPEDLHAIADNLEALNSTLTTENGNLTPAANLLGDIEVQRPESNEIIGHYVFEDGWIGFRFGGAE